MVTKGQLLALLAAYDAAKSSTREDEAPIKQLKVYLALPRILALAEDAVITPASINTELKALGVKVEEDFAIEFYQAGTPTAEVLRAISHKPIAYSGQSLPTL